LRLFSFGGYGLALAALALMVFGAIECPPQETTLGCLAFALLSTIAFSPCWFTSRQAERSEAKGTKCFLAEVNAYVRRQGSSLPAKVSAASGE